MRCTLLDKSLQSLIKQPCSSAGMQVLAESFMALVEIYITDTYELRI